MTAMKSTALRKSEEAGGMRPVATRTWTASTTGKGCTRRSELIKNTHEKFKEYQIIC